VSLYVLSDAGARTQLASAITDAQGAFNLPYSLQSGRVYLLEAIGGQYVNEISGAMEALTTPIRAVFVASGSESHFTISALSEAMALEIERSALQSKWQADAIAAATGRVNAALGLPNVINQKYVNLPSLTAGSHPELTSDQISFSLQVGFFAGFWQELRLRTPGLSLSQALQNFHSTIVDATSSSEDSIALFAGLMRFLEKVPAIDKSGIYALLGLPSNASSATFNGAESTGQASAVVPNWTLRYLSPPNMASATTADTFFDSRGALLAMGFGPTNSAMGFKHVGYSSVAEVYGDTEIAIGRWNHGFYYPSRVTFNQATNIFVTDNVRLEALPPDFVYAAGAPATNPPSCGTVVMAPQAQTKALLAFDGSQSLTLDASSRIAFYHSNGLAYVGYNIVLRDSQSNQYVFTSPGGADAPWQSGMLEFNKEFGSYTRVALPSGEDISFRGLLAGNGATKAVISISSNISSFGSGGLSAAFTQLGATQPCATPSFSAGSISPLPVTGNYAVNVTGVSYFMSGVNFFSNGTPDLLSLAGVTAQSGLEKHGNDLAGIGILVPPFSYQGDSVTVPHTYFYLSTPSNWTYPTRGIGNYHLIASTPVLVKRGNSLISSSAAVQTASLTIHFDEYPLGTVSANYGTCELVVDGRPVPTGPTRYYTSSCNDGTGLVDGGITSGTNQYAVIKYTGYYGNGFGEVALLFEKNP
jgi:hypothetical protein